jgi:hypothetical protein
MVSKTGFFIFVTNTGVLQVGGFGAPAGVQVTNLISSGFTPGPVVLRYEIVILPSGRTWTQARSGPVSALALMEIELPQLSPLVHAVSEM